MRVATAFAVGVAVVVSQTWFEPGAFIAQGDIPPFVRTAIEAEYTWSWNHELTGAGSPSFQIVRAFEVLTLDLVELLGGGDVSAQRAYYGALLALAAFGAACFARRFTSSPPAVALAGLFSFLNPFVLTQIPNPLVLVAIAVMGVAGSLIVAAAQGLRPRPLALAVTTVGCAYLLLNVVLVVIAACWMLGLVVAGTGLAGPGGTRRASAFVLRAVPWALALNLWWIVPAVDTFVGPGAPAVEVSSDVRTWAWTHARGSIANVLSLHAVWSWSYPEYFPYARTLDAPTWDWLRFVAPSVCLSAPLLSTGVLRRRALVLVGAVLVGVFVGKGLHPPLTGLNLWLYDHVPGFWLLREPIGKVGPALVLVYGALVAIAATGVASRVAAYDDDRRRRVTTGAAMVVAVALLAFPYPLWNGGLFPDERPVLPSPNVRLAPEWRAAADHLNAQPASGKTLVLPVADFYQIPTTWGYYGIDAVPRLLLRQPTIQPIPQNYFGEGEGFIGLVRQVEDALVRGEGEAVPRLLRSLGVSRVLVRGDVDRAFAGRRIADPSAMRATLSSTPGVVPTRSFGVVDVYEVEGRSSGMVQARQVDDRTETTGPPPAPRWRRDNPARYRIDIESASGPFMLVLTETYDPGWTLKGLPEDTATRHERIDGYANGWFVAGGPENMHLVAEYVPARRSRAALELSIVAAALAAVVFARGAFRAGLRGRGPDRHPSGPE